MGREVGVGYEMVSVGVVAMGYIRGLTWCVLDRKGWVGMGRCGSGNGVGGGVICALGIVWIDCVGVYGWS